jgi:hypothetical protein
LRITNPHSRRTRVLSACAAGAAALTLVAAHAATAATSKPSGNHPNGCPPDPWYSTWASYGKFIVDPDKQVYGQSGVTLSISASSGTTFSGTVGGSVSGDIDAIIASASATINTSITYSKTTTVTLGGSWTVPASQSVGWLALGSQGYGMNWAYYEYTAPCGVRTIRSGTANLPALAPVIGHS